MKALATFLLLTYFNLASAQYSPPSPFHIEIRTNCDCGGNGKWLVIPTTNATWQLFGSVDLTNWTLFFTKHNQKPLEKNIEVLLGEGDPMQYWIVRPLTNSVYPYYTPVTATPPLPLLKNRSLALPQQGSVGGPVEQRALIDLKALIETNLTAQWNIISNLVKSQEYESSQWHSTMRDMARTTTTPNYSEQNIMNEINKLREDLAKVIILRKN